MDENEFKRRADESKAEVHPKLQRDDDFESLGGPEEKVQGAFGKRDNEDVHPITDIAPKFVDKKLDPGQND